MWDGERKKNVCRRLYMYVGVNAAASIDSALSSYHVIGCRLSLVSSALILCYTRHCRHYDIPGTWYLV